MDLSPAEVSQKRRGAAWHCAISSTVPHHARAPPIEPDVAMAQEQGLLGEEAGLPIDASLYELPGDYGKFEPTGSTIEDRVMGGC